MRGAPIITAALILLAAGPANAAEAGLFGLFRGICGPGLEPAGVAARATAQGFTPAKKPPKSDGATETRSFEKTIDGREFFVVAARRSDKAEKEMPASSTLICGAGVKGKDEAGLAAGRAWAGVPAAKSILGVSIYLFTQQGGRKAVGLKDKAAARAAVEAGDLHTLTASGIGGASLLLLTRTRAE